MMELYLCCGYFLMGFIWGRLWEERKWLKKEGTHGS